MPKINKIIVTGGAGFVGTNLIKLLLKKTKFFYVTPVVNMNMGPLILQEQYALKINQKKLKIYLHTF